VLLSSARLLCSLPRALTWATLRILLGPGQTTVKHLGERLPGLSILTNALLSGSASLDHGFTLLTDTPLRLLLPRLLYAPAAALALLLPYAATAAFRARYAWHLCFMDVRLTEQASVAEPTSFSIHGRSTMSFGESVWDLVRDFTAGNSARAAAAAEFTVLAALAAAVPLWLLLLPPRRAAAALFAILLVLCLFGVLQMHWWAERAADEVAAADSEVAAEMEPAQQSSNHGDGESADGTLIAVSEAATGLTGSQDGRQAPAHHSCRDGVPACDGSLIAYFLLSLLPAQLFLGSGHFPEFAGLQWTAAFVGFEDSSSPLARVRSGALVAVNAFAPQAIAVLLLLIAAAMEVHAQSALLDGAAADGYALQRPHRVPQSGTAVAVTVRDLHAVTGLVHASNAPALAAVTRRDAEWYNHRSNDIPRFVTHMGRAVWEFTGHGPLQRMATREMCSRLVKAGSPNGAAFDPGASPQQWTSAQHAHAVFCNALLTRAGVAALELACASLNAFIQRRHLMIWALFAPKWMFEACFWAVSMATLLWAATVADACVSHVLPSASGGIPMPRVNGPGDE
jgi:hypothetical protein